jgi:hypothetical protein
MTEHALLAFLSILTTIACCLLGILIVSLRSFKKEMKDGLNEVWDRVNHHYHNGGGNVVIPTTAPRK